MKTSHFFHGRKRLIQADGVVLALVIAIAPMFLDCQSQGRSLTTSTGMSVPMKCHWTAIAEIGVGVQLAVVGILTAVNRNKGILGILSVFGLAAGTLAILFPSALIGVCAAPMMFCNMVMKPILLTSGTITLVASAVLLVTSLSGLRVPTQAKGAAA